ncbi:MAG: hypothetical protein ACO1NY_15150 [Pseudorhodoplanes sp.]
MAMELYVLSDRRLTSVAEWQRAIDAEAFALRLQTDIQLESLRGFLPAEFAGKTTGFECYHDDPDEFFGLATGIDFGHRRNCVLGLRWIGDLTEFQAAWMAGVAYARATSGTIYDPEEGELYEPSEGLQVVREIEQKMPTIKAAITEAEKKILTKLKLAKPRPD